MSYRSIRDNPIWLYIGSLIIFSLLVIVFLFFRKSLFGNLNKPYLQVSPTVLPTSTSSPQLSVSIPVLQQKKYIPVEFTDVRNVEENNLFTSKIISFKVDGLLEYALLDIPTGNIPNGGFPVIILDHGYINPAIYDTVSSYSGPTNFFASHGYIVIKPDYRGNGQSEGVDDPLKRFNYPQDVMAVIASIANIPNANTRKIYLWGHSMGGEVTLTVMEILGKQQNLAKDIKAVVLWAPVTDPAQWFSIQNLKKIPEATLTPFPYSQTFQILGQPSDNSSLWQSINPLKFLSDIKIPVQLNHGTGDPTVPYNMSIDLVQKMKNAGKKIDFISYPGADHNLVPDTFQALQNNLQYFNSH